MQQIVLAYVGLALLLVHLAVNAAVLWSHVLVYGIGDCRLRDRVAWVQSKGRAVQRQVMMWLRGQEDKDHDLGYLIAKRQMRSLCVQRTRRSFAMLRSALAMYISALVWGEFVLRRGWPGVNTVQVTILLSTYSVMLAIQVWPNMVNERTLDCWYALFSITMIACDSNIDNAEEFGLWGRLSAVAQLIAAFGCSRTRLVILVSLSMAVCRAILYAKIFPTTMASLFDPNVNIVVTEIICGLWIVAISHIFHAQTFVRLHRGVVEDALRHEVVAMTRLLDLTCDVVVEMDSGLRISRPSPKLAAMLMLGSNLPVVDSRLQDFMPLASDRVHLQTVGAGLLQDDSEALPSAMHATLRGPNSSLLQVEVLFAIFSGIDGAKRFLAGIREVTDARVAELPSWDPPLHSQDHCERAPSDGSSQGSDRRRRTYRRGTPPVSIRLPLGGADDELMSIASQHSLMDTRFKETSSAAKELSMLGTMTFWNVSVPRGSCCAFHSYLGEAVACCSTLAQRKCFSDLQLAGDVQCQECGILADWPQDSSTGDDQGAPQECDVCFARAVRRPRATSQAPPLQSL